jgi:hypothetical protein
VLAPALKIVKEKLDLIDNYPEIKNGHKFAAVALYSASKESLNNSCWSDFHPIVVDCLAKEKIDCRIALKRIKPLAWECLDMSLQSMKKNRIPGLYHVELPSSIVSGTF